MSAYGNIDLAHRGDEGRRLRLRRTSRSSPTRWCSRCARPRSARRCGARTARCARRSRKEHQLRATSSAKSDAMQEHLPHHRQDRRVQDHRAASPARAASARSWWRARIHRRSAARERAVRGGQLRRDPREPAGERAVRAQARRLHRRHAATSAACSRRPTAARCSSTRSASCRSALQVKLLRVLQEEHDPAARRHQGREGRRAHRRGDRTATCGRRRRPGASARTSSTASTCCRSRCRRCASGARTSRC